jgi:hypothetical protein
MSTRLNSVASHEAWATTVGLTSTAAGAVRQAKAALTA